MSMEIFLRTVDLIWDEQSCWEHIVVGHQKSRQDDTQFWIAFNLSRDLDS